MKNWQNHVSDAAVRALDKGTDAIGDSGHKVIRKLSKQWRSMSDAEKRELVEIVIAVGGAVGVAVNAIRKRGSAKKQAKKSGSKLLKKLKKK